MKKGILALCIVLMVVQNIACAQVNIRYSNEVIEQVNEERLKYGLSSLKVDPELSHAAYIRALEITDVFSHTRPDGSKWSTVSARAKGENLAMGYGYPEKVMAAWMTSNGHRKNIIKRSYGSIGVCVYEHNGVLYWVQLFGK